MNRKVLSIPVDPKFGRQVRIMAASEDKTVARYVREILEEKVKEWKDKKRELSNGTQNSFVEMD